MCTIAPWSMLRRNVKKSGICSCYLMHQRGYADSRERDEKKGHEKKNLSFRKYWMSRYMDYIKNYQTTLDKNFPTTMHVYRVFSIGSKEFYSELKKYISVRKKQKAVGMKSLTREELQLWHTFPNDLVKISPLLMISAIPFTNYIIFPMAYLFPRVLLTSHYWSIEQRFNFILHYHKKRLRHNKPLLRCLQDRVETIKNPLLRVKWRGVIACLGSGTHPTSAQIVACIDLFSGPPYSLDSLTRKHTKELLAIHGMHRWPLYRRERLSERGMLIKYMDDSIKREGGVEKLPNDAIRWILVTLGSVCNSCPNFSNLGGMNTTRSNLLNQASTVIEFRGFPLPIGLQHPICLDKLIADIDAETLQDYVVVTTLALSFRGVNPVNMSRENMQTWLEYWLLISSQVEPRSISLLLHSPILLGYNYPTNWTLLYH